MARRKIRFPGAFGDQLAARLDTPQGTPTAYALFAHCFTCSKDLRAAGWISHALVARNIAVLRFDFTGIGESEGDFADTDFSSNLDDLVAAADYLRDEHAAPQILIGHSLGGTAVLAAAGRVDEVEAVATIAAPSDTQHLAGILREKDPDIEAEGEAEVELAGRPFRIKQQLLDDLEQHDMERRIHDLRRALLIFHSPLDGTVGIDHARRIFEAAQHPKSFVSLDRADHLMTDEQDARYVGEVLAAWAGRYVESDTSVEVTARDDEGELGQVTVIERRPKYRQRVLARGHELTADEPEEAGGGDSGPTPYDLLLAALGTCTSMTLRMYADRKEWPLEGVRVTLDHDRIHAKDCERCMTESGMVDHIDRRLTILGPLDDDQRARLLEIADKCPVHRTLKREIDIETTLS